MIIPEKYMGRILILDNWDEPEGFLEMSTQERRELRTKLLNFNVEPTQDNFWIWFGEYRAPTYSAMWMNTYVLRDLYQLNIGELDKKRRLTNNIGKYFSDVNPYRAIPSTRAVGSAKGTLRKIDTRGIRGDRLFNPKPKTKPAKVLDPQDEIKNAIEAAMGLTPKSSYTNSDLFDGANVDPTLLFLCKESIIENGFLAEFLPMAIDFYKNEGTYDEDTVRAAYKALYPNT